MIMINTRKLVVEVGVRLWDKRWRVREGFEIEVENEKSPERAWPAIACYDPVEEYGFGDTEAEAVEDLLSSMVEYCQSLEERESKLGKQGREHLRILRELFEHE